MSKLCSVCGTENRDEAQFCRACGTAFAAAKAAAAPLPTASAANVCAECGFQNKPGIRYCANCGMSLAGAPPARAATRRRLRPTRRMRQRTAADFVSLVRDGVALPDGARHRPLGALRPAGHPRHPRSRRGDRAAPAGRRRIARRHARSAFQNPPAPNRAPLILGIVLAVLAVAGVAAWLFMGSSNPAPPVAAPTPTSVTPPVAATPTPAPPTAPPIIVEEAPPATAPTSGERSARRARWSPPPAAAAAPLGTPPAAAAPLPQLGDPAVESAEAEAKRLAAEKRRDEGGEGQGRARRQGQGRGRAARPGQRRRSAARRAGCAGEASRRGSAARTAEHRGRRRARRPLRSGRRAACARSAPAAARSPRRSASRASAALAEHANEQICRQLREADERRRNMQ